jgi:hypothetical protein
LQEAAKSIGLRLQVFRASNVAEIEAAYEAIARERIPAVMVLWSAEASRREA